MSWSWLADDEFLLFQFDKSILHTVCIMGSSAMVRNYPDNKISAQFLVWDSQASVSSATAEPQQTGLAVGKTAVTHLYVPVNWGNILPVAWVVQQSQEVLQCWCSSQYSRESVSVLPVKHHRTEMVRFHFAILSPSLAKSDSGVMLRLVFVGFKSVMRSYKDVKLLMLITDCKEQMSHNDIFTRKASQGVSSSRQMLSAIRLGDNPGGVSIVLARHN